MNDYPTYKPKYNDDDAFNWEDLHGVGFLLKVLWELGHPEETYETLIEVLESVHEKTGALITNLDDASFLHVVAQDIQADDHGYMLEVRQKRIDARNLLNKNACASTCKVGQ